MIYIHEIWTTKLGWLKIGTKEWCDKISLDKAQAFSILILVVLKIFMRGIHTYKLKIRIYLTINATSALL